MHGINSSIFNVHSPFISCPLFLFATDGRKNHTHTTLDNPTYWVITIGMGLSFASVTILGIILIATNPVDEQVSKAASLRSSRKSVASRQKIKTPSEGATTTSLDATQQDVKKEEQTQPSMMHETTLNQGSEMNPQESAGKTVFVPKLRMWIKTLYGKRAKKTQYQVGIETGVAEDNNINKGGEKIKEANGTGVQGDDGDFEDEDVDLEQGAFPGSKYCYVCRAHV